MGKYAAARSLKSMDNCFWLLLCSALTMMKMHAAIAVQERAWQRGINESACDLQVTSAFLFAGKAEMRQAQVKDKRKRKKERQEERQTVRQRTGEAHSAVAESE